MFEIPEDFNWKQPWAPILDEPYHLEWGHSSMDTPPDQQVADTLVGELKREIPAGHVLDGLEVKAVGYCTDDPNDFLFTTSDPEKPLAAVHLTWSEEKVREWPQTKIYSSLEAWEEQMNREHNEVTA